MNKSLMQRILVAAIGVPLLILVLAVLPDYFVPVAVSIINVCCTFEVLRAIGVPDKKRIYAAPCISAVAIPWGAYFGYFEIVCGIAIYAVTVVMFLEFMLGRKRKNGFGLRCTLAGIFTGSIQPVFLSFLVKLKLLDNGTWLVLLPFIISMFSDTGGYFVGIAIGKNHPFPDVSPKKSIEGCIGSLACGVIFAVIYGVFVRAISGINVNLLYLAIIGLIANPFVQFGDLAFSAIKREMGIKDYSRLLGDHGGMQDRFDSLYFGVPVVWALINVFPVFK